MTILSEHVSTWAKRIQTQRAQMVIISSLHEIKNFDTIMHKDGKERETRPTTTLTISTRRRCKYCGSSPQTKTIPGIWDKV